MIDLLLITAGAPGALHQVNLAQQELAVRRANLEGLLQGRFDALCDAQIRTGMRITARLESHPSWGRVKGRAVVLKNGTSWGLYVEIPEGRFEAARPYDQVRILPSARQRKARK